jgi:1,4-alpha-glucan branching enzyme
MHATHSGALWTVTVPLTPGRYRYAFLVNGSRWLADPAAPRAQDDFDTPSSVVTVGG